MAVEGKYIKLRKIDIRGSLGVPLLFILYVDIVDAFSLIKHQRKMDVGILF